jgi:hypothetical protein
MPFPSRREVRANLDRRPWVVGLMFLVTGHLVLILTRTYIPGGDWAFIELRTRDVFSRQSPLTGAWSRYGWTHPGPILYDLLAVPYRLMASSWRGLWLGSMVINTASLLVAVRLIEPRAADPGVRADPIEWLPPGAFAVAGMWTIAAGTPHLFTDPWNASVVVLPVIVMVAATSAVLLSQRPGVAVAAVVYVAAAQTHAAYGVLLLPLVVIALGIGIVRWRRHTLTWIGVGSLLMLPALVDTLVDWPGNLYRSIRFTLTATEPAVGFGQSLRVIGRATSLTFFTEPRLPSFVAIVRDPPRGVVPFAAVIALAAAHRLAKQRSWSAHQRTLEMTAVLWLVGGVLMVSRTRGPLLIWLTTWMVAAAALTWSLVVAVIVRWALERQLASSSGGESTDRPRSSRLTGRAAVATPMAIGVVVAGLATANLVGSVGEGYPFQELTPVVQQFADDAEPYAVSPIVIDLRGDEYVAGAVQSALILELEERGFEPRGRPDQRLQLGDHRADVPLGAPMLQVSVESLSTPPVGATVVSVWDPLDTAERAEADELAERLGALLDDAGVGDRRPLLDNDLAPLAAIDAPPSVVSELASFERLAALRSRGPRVVLYLVRS